MVIFFATERTYANSFSYTPDGRIEKLKLGNSRWEWAKFNERLQVTELNLGSGVQDASLWKLKYEYGEIDSNGNVNTVKNTGNIARMTTSFNGLANPFVQSFKYDSLYRLVEAKETANNQQTWKQNFTYDRYGNRLTHDKFTGTTQQVLDNKTHPSINPATNRFNTNQGYTYDFNGNLISDAENRQFTFNGDNKQSEIKINNEPIGRYFYDGEGKRVKKITNFETVVFVYDGLGKLIGEYSTKEPPANPTTSYTATDHLGSPRVITDSQGNVTSRRDFLPFGEELTPDGVNRTANLKYNLGDGIRQKFTGYQKDEETNLDFAEARMYENRHARFTAVDPLLASGKSANPQTFNRYAYTSNNPINRVDINGLDWYVAFRKASGRWYITPKWCGGFGCRGYRWGTSGSFKLDGQVRDWDARSFAFQDERHGGFVAYDFYEKRDPARFNTIEDAQAQITAWNRQAAVNFLAGALEGASLAAELTGAADGLKADRNSQMFKMGVKAGTGAQIAGALTGVGLFNALTSGYKGARSIFKGINVVCCFVAGTPIRTDKGLVPIEQIKIGDKVLSYDEKTKRFEYKSVAQTFIAVKENIVKIKIRGEKLLTTTTEHPFYVRKTNRARDSLSSGDDEEGEWLTAAELKVGQRVLRPDGKWTRITSIEQSSEPTLVYNLEVEGNHNYFVGEIGVLSHNCNLKQSIDAFKNAVIPAEKISGADWNKVSDYVGTMRSTGGWIGDPAKVTNINGQLILIDGHHRVQAAMEAGVDVVYQMVRAEDLPQEILRTAEQIANDARRTGGWSTRP